MVPDLSMGALKCWDGSRSWSPNAPCASSSMRNGLRLLRLLRQRGDSGGPDVVALGGFITSAAALAGRPPEADLVGREIGGDGGVFEHVR